MQLVKLKTVGEGAESEILRLISAHELSAFDYDKAQEFIENTKREISTLTLILDEVNKANEDIGMDLFTIVDATQANDFGCKLSHE